MFNEPVAASLFLDDDASRAILELPKNKRLTMHSREREFSRCGGMTDAGIARLQASSHIEELRLRETPFSAEP